MPLPFAELEDLLFEMGFERPLDDRWFYPLNLGDGPALGRFSRYGYDHRYLERPEVHGLLYPKDGGRWFFLDIGVFEDWGVAVRFAGLLGGFRGLMELLGYTLHGAVHEGTAMFMHVDHPGELDFTVQVLERAEGSALQPERWVHGADVFDALVDLR